MKKAINKSERAAIIQGLVVEACLKNGKKVVEGLKEQFNSVRAVMQQNFDETVPELFSRERQLTLLRDRVMNCASSVFKVGVWEKGWNAKEESWAFRDFGYKAFNTPTRSDSMRAQDELLWEAILRKLPEFSKYVQERYLGHANPSLHIKTTFVDVPTSVIDNKLYDPSKSRQKYLPAEIGKYNEALFDVHIKTVALLEKLFDILLSASAMRDELQSVFSPIKTPVEMAELFPEAVKHFPESMSYVRPTKELADPAAINEIRAKLKAGLPI